MRLSHLAVPTAFLSVGLLCGSANAAILVEDFETGTVGGAAAAGDAAVTAVSGGSGGSSFALEVTRPTGGWSDTFNVNISGLLGDLAGHTKLSVDIKASGGSDVPGWWLQVFPIFNLSTGYFQGGDMGGNLNGAWNTYTWDYATAGVPATTPAWGQLSFTTQGGAGGDPAHMTFFVDNIQFIDPIPEPASLSLLALTTLATRRRRN